MKLTMRKYRDEADYWRFRQFLRDVFCLNDRRLRSWHIARLDYCRWHSYENINHNRLEDVVYICETATGEFAAVLNPEDNGDAHLQIRPDVRTPALEEEMLLVAEANLAYPNSEGQRRLRVWADQHDDMRHNLFQKHGYTRCDWPEYQRRCLLDAPIPQPEVSPGYTIRALGDADEIPARSWVSWKAFHPDEPDEHYEGWEWYHNIQRMPLYRRDLDIVADAGHGELAAFCTVWYDDATRSAYFEPVGTAPAHQRRGLGKAVLFEGLRRLQRMGATLAYVCGFSDAANALYASAGFTDYDLYEPWEKAVG